MKSNGALVKENKMNLMQLPDEQNSKRQDPEEIKIGNVNSKKINSGKQ